MTGLLATPLALFDDPYVAQLEHACHLAAGAEVAALHERIRELAADLADARQQAVTFEVRAVRAEHRLEMAERGGG